jgi:hypothetical protein
MAPSEFDDDVGVWQAPLLNFVRETTEVLPGRPVNDSRELRLDLSAKVFQSLVLREGEHADSIFTGQATESGIVAPSERVVPCGNSRGWPVPVQSVVYQELGTNLREWEVVTGAIKEVLIRR